jgi:hypothetical protein
MCRLHLHRRRIRQARNHLEAVDKQTSYGECAYSSTFLYSALGGGEWSAARSSCFTPGEGTPGTRWIGGWVGLRAGLDTVEERKRTYPCGNRTPARLSTDWAIPAHKHFYNIIKFPWVLCLSTIWTNQVSGEILSHLSLHLVNAKAGGLVVYLYFIGRNTLYNIGGL